MVLETLVVALVVGLKECEEEGRETAGEPLQYAGDC